MDKNGLLIVFLLLFMIVLDRSNALNSRKLVASPDPNGSSNAIKDSPLPSPPSTEKKPNPSDVETKGLNDANPKTSPDNSSGKKLDKGKSQDGKEKVENQTQSKTFASESCKGNPICNDQGKTMIACIRDLENGSNNLSLLVHNERDTTLKVNLTFGTSMNNYVPAFDIPGHGTEKVNITFSGDESTKIILNAGNGDCELQIGTPKTTQVDNPSKAKDVDNPSNPEDVDDPAKPQDIEDPAKLKDVDHPADSPVKPKDVDSPADSPAKPKNATDPAKSKEDNDPAKSKEDNAPSKGKEADSPARPKEVDSRARPKEVNSPARPKEVNSPAKSPKGVDDPGKSKDVDSPAKSKDVDDGAKSKDADDASKSKDADDASKSKDANGASKSKDADDALKSKDADDASKSKDTDDASKSKDANGASKSKDSKSKDADDASKSKDADDASKSKDADDASKSKDINDPSKSQDMESPPKSKSVDVPPKSTSVDTPISQSNLLTQLSFYSKQVTPIYGAYFAFLGALVIGGSWALCSFRKRRTDSGVPYQELEMGLPESSQAVDVETAEGWEQDWDDDDWDEDKAIRSPGGGIQAKTISSNGLTSRATRKDGWDADWDD